MEFSAYYKCLGRLQRDCPSRLFLYLEGLAVTGCEASTSQHAPVRRESYAVYPTVPSLHFRAISRSPGSMSVAASIPCASESLALHQAFTEHSQESEYRLKPDEMILRSLSPSMH